MIQRSFGPWLPVALLVFGLLMPDTASARKGKRSASGGVKIMVYEGKLQNSEGRAISGIFPLTFELHRRARGGRSVWKEKHFVAVDAGAYTVELGRVARIKGSIDLSRVYLGVSMGKAELFREKLDQAIVKDTAAAPAPAPAPVTGPATPAVAPVQPSAATGAVKTKNGRTMVDYAEEAGEAYVAGQAKVAERIGSLKAKDIEDAVKKLKKFKGGASLGTKKRYTKLVGGERGVEYSLMCPKGHVVTGLTGGAGLYIDSIKLICQPLE